LPAGRAIIARTVHITLDLCAHPLIGFGAFSPPQSLSRSAIDAHKMPQPSWRLCSAHL
jgi:hypothetical protein